MTASARRRAELDIARLLEIEAHYSAARRAGSAAARVQAEEIRRMRERAERALDFQPPAVESLPLFEEA